MPTGSVPSRVLSALAVLLVSTACATAPPQPAEPSGVALPERPRDVPISGIDPCDLLDDAQRADLGLDGNPVPYEGANPLLGNPAACSISGFQPRAIAFNISLADDRGIDIFTGGRLASDVTAIDVGGFPAVLAPPPPSMPDNCIVAIDIAPGQVLSTMLADGGRLPPITVDELCADAPRYAAEVLTTLLQR